MKEKILTRLKNNLWVVVLDIIAVNAAFILALLLRYYVHQVFYASARQFLDTGLRPGEKLYEEKLMAEEGLQKTDNDLIHIGNPIKFDEDAFLVELEGLVLAAYANKDGQIRGLVKDMVSTYHPEDDKANDKAGRDILVADKT